MTIPWGSKHPLTIYQQGGFEETFEVYEALPSGEPDLDAPTNFLDGTTAIAQVRKNEKQDSDLLAEFSVVIEDNKLILTLTSEQTLAIPVIYGFYDVFVTEPDAQKQMFVQGKVTIDRAVSAEPEPVEP